MKIFNSTYSVGTKISRFEEFFSNFFSEYNLGVFAERKQVCESRLEQVQKATEASTDNNGRGKRSTRRKYIA